MPKHLPASEMTDTICPVCGSNDITGGPIETGGDTAVQEMSCADCNQEWKNVYDFAAVAFEDVVVEIPK